MSTLAVPVPGLVSARCRVRDYAARALTRLRVQEALNSTFVACVVSSCLLVLLLLADRLFSLDKVGIPVWIIWGGLTALGIPYVLWRMYSPRLHENLAAVLADDRLRLQARLSTALTLDLADHSAADFSEAFFAEAIERLEGLNVEQAFPLRVPRAFVVLLLPIVAAICIYKFMEPQDALGLVKARDEKRKAEEVRQRAASALEGKLEDLKRKIEERGDEKGGEYKVNQLIQQADNIAKELREGKRNPDDALLALGQLKREIQDEKEKLSQGKEFLDRLADLKAQDLNLDENDLTKDVSEALKMGDAGLAARQLRKLAKQMQDAVNDPNKTPEQKKQQMDKLQREIEKLAGALAEDEALREGLKELSQDVMNAADFQALQEEIRKHKEKQGEGNKKLGDDIERQAEQVAEELERLDEDNDANLTEEDEEQLDDLDAAEEGIDEAMEGLANPEGGEG
jgi:hypothetical protein